MRYMTKAFDKTSQNPCPYSKKAGKSPLLYLRDKILLTQIELRYNSAIPLNICLI